MKKVLFPILALVLALSLALPMALPVGASPGPGIVGLWHFDEGTGATASDSSGNANDGTLSGGKFGNALDFDGDYMWVGSSSSLDFNAAGQDFSAEAWIKCDVLKDYDLIFQQEDDVSYTGRAWLYVRANGAVRSFIGGSATETTAGLITAGNWYHVAVTFDKGDGSQTGTLKIYVNDVEKASSTRTFEPSIGDYRIGIHKADTHDFDGIIDEVRISDVARTSFGLTSAPSLPEANTVALWHFDESVGSTAFDETANDNDGTINGASWAGPTWTTSGMFDDALSFDGVDDYVDCGDISTQDWSDLTTEAWVWWDGGTVSGYAGVYYKAYHNDIGRLLINSSGKVLVQNGNGNFFSDNNGDVPTNQWCHVVYTYDQSAGKEYIYVDGAKKGEQSRSGDIAQNSAGFRIGYGWHGSTYYVFSGLIDEVRIWDEALTADQIALSYSGSVNWLPPVTNADFVLKDGTTLPLKFQLFNDSGLVCSEQPISLEVTGPASFTPISFQLGEGLENLRWNADECYYIANIKTKVGNWPEGTYTATVGGIVTGVKQFNLSPGKGVGRGNSGK